MFRQSSCFQFFANWRRPFVLPHNGVVNGLPCLSIPDHGRFPLVGNPNGSYGGGAHAVLFNYFDQHSVLGFPDFPGIVFDPPGLWENLAELLLCNGLDLAFRINEDGTRTSSALIQCNNIFFLTHCCLLLLPTPACFSYPV